ncbi:MAG: serine--tRNA ligase [Candidatus Roizmanbacteria bacterium]|nr:serine--tRNA ligase [Candidatus Roizmanbacteria bacterium]
MLSIHYIREHADLVEKTAALKNRKVDIQKILGLDEQHRTLQAEIQELRQRRNQLAKGGNTPEVVEEGKQLKKQLKEKEDQERELNQELNMLLLTVPNVPYDEVPEGKGEEDNKELRKEGTIREFSFEPKSHIDLINSLGLADLERGSKVSGFRGYFLKDKLALLHMAVLWYTFQKLSQKGYMPLIAPALVKDFTLFGNGQFPWGKEEVYHLEKDDVYLAGTAEVPVTAYYSNETLSEEDLPKKFVALSPCFRREAGSYGKDTKGLYRVHEFWKIEQVVIAPSDDQQARELHEELQANTESILQDLELPYRVLLMCTGDMGEPQAKKYDTEVWMPYRKGYGEIASNSIMTDFQARRLNIRYRTKSGETKFVYTLNDTAVPSPRILIAILENYQQADGSITIPKALTSLCGFTNIEVQK